MNTSSRTPKATYRHLVGRGVAVLAAGLIAVGAAGPGVVAAPSVTTSGVVSQHQNVDWMSSDTASYLGSIGMDVMVPSWIPAPFTGVAPDVYAGDGSYSLYWMAPGAPPTFLHITGVVGAAFPAGSKADLNVELSINESVQGWPAIRDIGIPAGSDTPIYDQVWWIVDGVRFSVESNNIGTDSLTIANSMLHLQAPVYVAPTQPPVYVEPTSPPVYVEPTAPQVVEEPQVPPTSEPVWEEPTSVPMVQEPVSQEPVSQQPTTGSTGGVGGPTAPLPPTTSSGSTSSDAGDSDSSTGPWSPDRLDGDVPSDGTAGPRPPVIGGDGTGGSFDTSLPRLVDRRP